MARSIHSLFFSLVGSSLLAQSAVQDPVPYPVPDLRRQIPANMGSGEAVRLVEFDADCDLISDFAIKWSGGEVTFAYAPEILSSFVAAPTSLARDICRIPRAFAPAAVPGRDGLLVADAAGLGHISLSPNAPGNLQRLPVVAPTAWHESLRLETYVANQQCLVLGLSPDKRELRVGTWNAGSITHLAAVATTHDIQQFLAVDFLQNGTPCLAARTTHSMEVWTLAGTPLFSSAAPTAHTLGSLVSYRDGAQENLAWAVVNGPTWRLRTFQGPNPLQDTQITYESATQSLPPRFRLVGLSSASLGAGSTSCLLLHQNTMPWHIVMAKDSTGQFVATGAVEAPDTTLNVDNCPSLCLDLDHDGVMDVASVLTSQHCLQFQLGMTTTVQTQAAPAAPTGAAPDYLPQACELVASPGNSVLDILRLRVQVPSTLQTTANLGVQVVAWPQYVANPPGPNFHASPAGAPIRNLVFPVPATGGINSLQIVLPLPLPVVGPWAPNDQYYLMVRVLRFATPLVIGGPPPDPVWTSTPQMVGMVAHEPYRIATDDDFMASISTPSTPPDVRIRAEPREVGIMLKPARISPPASTLVVPAAGQGTVVVDGGIWL